MPNRGLIGYCIIVDCRFAPCYCCLNHTHRFWVLPRVWCSFKDKCLKDAFSSLQQWSWLWSDYMSQMQSLTLFFLKEKKRWCFLCGKETLRKRLPKVQWLICSLVVAADACLQPCRKKPLLKNQWHHISVKLMPSCTVQSNFFINFIEFK